ncbi:MAG: hypothetical protein ACPK85_10340 [Methanosarcina sp.]
MLQNIIQMYHSGYPIKKSVKQNLTAVSNSFDNIEFNHPLLYFVVPGFVFIAVGLSLSLNLILTVHLGGRLPFGPTVLMIMLNVIGIGMAFTGILLHSITGMIAYNENKF